MVKKAESRLQQRIQKALKKEVGGKWWKVHGSMFQEAGQPDIDGAVYPFYFKFEVKIPVEGAPSDIQLQTMKEWRKQGVISCIVETPSQAVALVKAALSTPNKRRRGRAQYRWICRVLRATHGEDMGYGRRTVRGGGRVPRRSARWAINQLEKYLGEVSNGKTSLVLGAP